MSRCSKRVIFQSSWHANVGLVELSESVESALLECRSFCHVRGNREDQSRPGQKDDLGFQWDAHLGWCLSLGTRNLWAACSRRHLNQSLCRFYCGRSLTILSQMVTPKAASLTPVFLCISPQDQTVVLRVASIAANASFASTTSIVSGASIQQSTDVSQLCFGCLW